MTAVIVNRRDRRLGGQRRCRGDGRHRQDDRGTAHRTRPALLLAVLVGALLGACNGVIIALTGISPIVVTFQPEPVPVPLLGDLRPGNIDGVPDTLGPVGRRRQRAVHRGCPRLVAERADRRGGVGLHAPAPVGAALVRRSAGRGSRRTGRRPGRHRVIGLPAVGVLAGVAGWCTHRQRRHRAAEQRHRPGAGGDRRGGHRWHQHPRRSAAPCWARCWAPCSSAL